MGTEILLILGSIVFAGLLSVGLAVYSVKRFVFRRETLNQREIGVFLLLCLTSIPTFHFPNLLARVFVNDIDIDVYDFFMMRTPDLQNFCWVMLVLTLGSAAYCYLSRHFEGTQIKHTDDSEIAEMVAV